MLLSDYTRSTTQDMTLAIRDAGKDRESYILACHAATELLQRSTQYFELSAPYRVVEDDLVVDVVVDHYIDGNSIYVSNDSFFSRALLHHMPQTSAKVRHMNAAGDAWGRMVYHEKREQMLALNRSMYPKLSEDQMLEFRALQGEVVHFRGSEPQIVFNHDNIMLATVFHEAHNTYNDPDVEAAREQLLYDGEVYYFEERLVHHNNIIVYMFLNAYEVLAAYYEATYQYILKHQKATAVQYVVFPQWMRILHTSIVVDAIRAVEMSTDDEMPDAWRMSLIPQYFPTVSDYVEMLENIHVFMMQEQVKKVDA